MDTGDADEIGNDGSKKWEIVVDVLALKPTRTKEQTWCEIQLQQCLHDLGPKVKNTFEKHK